MSSTGCASRIVAAILAAAIVVNVVGQLQVARDLPTRFPFIGAAGVGRAARSARRSRAARTGACCRRRLSGSVFLLSRWCFRASMMPVEALPAASWQAAFGLGFVSAVFDNIPLTALALKQGGYDWGFLAYAVGFGGSMIWFGSSAGVALASQFPAARSAMAWVARRLARRPGLRRRLRVHARCRAWLASGAQAPEHVEDRHRPGGGPVSDENLTSSSATKPRHR